MYILCIYCVDTDRWCCPGGGGSGGRLGRSATRWALSAAGCRPGAAPVNIEALERGHHYVCRYIRYWILNQLGILWYISHRHKKDEFIITIFLRKCGCIIFTAPAKICCSIVTTTCNINTTACNINIIPRVSLKHCIVAKDGWKGQILKGRQWWSECDRTFLFRYLPKLCS